MNVRWFCFCCWLGFFGATPCLSAGAGVLSFLDGNARLLRGTTWFAVVEGIRIQSGDIVEAADGVQVQIELPGLASVNFMGPAALYAVLVAAPDPKRIAASDFYFPRGWIKLSVSPIGRIRLRSSLAAVDASDAVIVLHGGDSLEMFVERGNLRLMEPGKSAADPRGHNLAAGEFASRLPDRAFNVAGRVSPSFVSAMPRHFMDDLPTRAEKFKSARPALVAQREVTYPEAEPWLTGPYRAVFVKRFRPRLADAAFRAALSASGQSFPELSPPAPAVKAEDKEKEKDKETEKDREKEKSGKSDPPAQKQAETEGFLQQLFGGAKNK